MKEYRQDPGGRRVKGDDLKVIQELALLSEQLLKQYGNFVISGCEVVGNTIGNGIVMLDGKACTFDGEPDATFPYYVKKVVLTEEVPYESGTGTGAGYELFQAVTAASSDEGAFRLDNASHFEDVFIPKNAVLAADAVNAINAVNAANAVNADTVDGQHFSWDNTSVNPKYIWSTDVNGQSFLTEPKKLSVKNADTVGNIPPSGLLLQPVVIPANADLSSYHTPGMYYCPSNADANTIANKPYDSTAFSLLVEKHAGIKQTFTLYPANNISTWVRNYYNGSWGAWYQTTTYDGSAVNAETLNGKHATDFILADNGTLPAGDCYVPGYWHALKKGWWWYMPTTTLANKPEDGQHGLVHIGGYGPECHITWHRQNGVTSFDMACNSSYCTAWSKNARATDNVASASQLQTVRTIWGQGFNGTGNVSGNMYDVGSISSNSTIRTSGVFSAGEYQNDLYGYFNVTRPTTINNASCYAMVRNETFSYGIGFNTSNQIVMGSTNSNKTINPWITMDSSGIFQGSDERIKNIKQNFEPAIEDIVSLPLFYYELKEYPGKEEIGTSAQKVREKFPELVSEDGDGVLSVNYSKLSVLALKGITLQNNEIKGLKDENKRLKDRISKIEQLLKINNNER